MKIILTTITLLAICGSSFGQQWGSIKGQFVFDGKAPAAAKIAVTKDAQVCGVKPLFDEELIVNPDNSGIQNVVVSLNVKRGGSVEVHPDYANDADSQIKFDNLSCRFEPHIVTLRTSQTLEIGNSDGVPHNTKIDTIKTQNAPTNPIVPPNKTVKYKFNVEESLPVTASCSIHPWMNAKIVVKDHPYVAVTDKDGKFEIKNIPAGKHEFQIWHEKVGYVKYGSWKRGKTTWEVKAGDDAEDVGTFKVKL